MTNHELWKVALHQADQIMAVVREQSKGMPEAYAFDFSSSKSSSKERFRRKGITQQQQGFSLPSDLAALVSSHANAATIPSSLDSNDNSYISDLLTRGDSSFPGLNVLQALQQIDPESFTGSDALATIASRNPFSTDYEDATKQLYDRQIAEGRAAAQSGPGNVRGGMARQGFELAEVDNQAALNRFREINAQQHQEAGIVTQAVQVANMIENMRRGTQMQAAGQEASIDSARTREGLEASAGLARKKVTNTGILQLAADLLGGRTQTVGEDLSGRGTQSGSSSGWNAGISCCFIFMEALNGKLPWYARQGRDQFNTPNRRDGYVWMSQWLIPMMQKFMFVRRFVNLVMIKPFLITGRWFYHKPRVAWVPTKDAVLGPVLKPWCYCWFYLWSFLGWLKNKF